MEAILKGSVDPDAYPEEKIEARVGRGGGVYFVRKRIRHHSQANKPHIMKILWKARRLLLKGKAAEASYWLGYALHYVQDAFIPPWNHAGAESAVGSNPVPMDEVYAAVREAECSPTYVENLLKQISPLEGEAAMREASRISAGIAAAVLGPLDPPHKLVEEEKAERGQHLLRTLIAAASAGLFLVSLLSPSPATLILLASAAASYMLDGKYRKIKKELKWFRKP